jgi:DNA-binding beta-propeller fold protein YncE
VIHACDAKTQRSNRLKFTRDRTLVLVSDLGAGDLVVFDARTRTERARLPLYRYPTGILIAPDGRYADVAVSDDDRIAVIDLRKLVIVKTRATGSSPDAMALVE